MGEERWCVRERECACCAFACHHMQREGDERTHVAVREHEHRVTERRARELRSLHAHYRQHASTLERVNISSISN